MLADIKNKQDIINLFPKSADEIENLVETYIAEAQEAIDKIIALPKEDRTYENTAKPLDELFSYNNLAILSSGLGALEMLSPEKEIRQMAHQQILKVHAFWIDKITKNVKLYKAFKAYAQDNAKKEDLSKEEKYFISETLNDYQKAGLDLPEEKLEQVKKINKKLAELGLAFETNIATDQSHILVTQEELEGVDEDFINSLPKTDDGKIILLTQYPIYIKVMDNCCIEETRKKFYLAFNNRAFPINREILKKII